MTRINVGDFVVVTTIGDDIITGTVTETDGHWARVRVDGTQHHVRRLVADLRREPPWDHATIEETPTGGTDRTLHADPEEEE